MTSNNVGEQINLRVPLDMRARLDRVAAEFSMSRNRVVLMLVEPGLDALEGQIEARERGGEVSPLEVASSLKEMESTLDEAKEPAPEGWDVPPAKPVGEDPWAAEQVMQEANGARSEWEAESSTLAVSDGSTPPSVFDKRVEESIEAGKRHLHRCDTLLKGTTFFDQGVQMGKFECECGHVMVKKVKA